MQRGGHHTGCAVLSKKTIDTILESGNNFLTAVKANQKVLLQRIRATVALHRPLDTHLTEEKSRGRRERRLCQLYLPPEGMGAKWSGVQRVVHVNRSGCRPRSGDYPESHYYITGHAFRKASKVAQGIREHWGIENKVHYVKDIHFNEDGNGIRNNNAAAVLSLVQDMAINIYRCKGFSPMKKATIFFANKIKELFKFLTAKHISDL
ncbi:MAG: ISAs1 family transposase [Bacteroidota bacterium]